MNDLTELSWSLNKHLLKFKILILIGAPLSGKTTFATSVMNIYNHNNLWQTVSIGNIIKKTIYNNSVFGKFSHNIIKHNQFINNKLLIILLSLELKTNIKNVIFDGFPRTIQQFSYWTNILSSNNNILIIEICCKSSLLKQRLRQRRICYSCLKTFINIDSCPSCKLMLQSRHDDNHALFMKRYDFYKSELFKIKQYMTEQKYDWKWITIHNDNNDLSKFQKHIKNILNNI